MFTGFENAPFLIMALQEILLPPIIGLMHKMEKLTTKEKQAQSRFSAKLRIAQSKTNRPIVVALIGLVGSGKSTVANQLAKEIGATVLEGDAIRVELRNFNERFEGTRKIAENIMMTIVQGGGNVILDSDHINPAKRASIRKKLKGSGAKLVFVRTYANFDIMYGRTISAQYSLDDFFGGALATWRGSVNENGAVVKLREMTRRIPHHYRWVDEGGGKWTLKNFPFKVAAEIDTGDAEDVRVQVNVLVSTFEKL